MISLPRFPAHALGLLALLALFSGAPVLASEPFIPASDRTVLARLSVPGHRPPVGTGEIKAGAVMAPHTAVRASGSERLSNTVAQATELVRQARAQSDPRLLSRARGMLREVWSSNEVPFDVLLLRAEIQEGLHAFEPALQDLDRALRLNPRHPGAWLLKATIHQVRGEYTATRQALLQLARQADELVTTTAATALAGLGNQAEVSARRLGEVLERHANAPAEIQAWAHATLGELEARLDRGTEAERSFQQALALDPVTPYPRAALADLWLDQGRCLEVLELLKDVRADALRLRRLEAEHRLAPEQREVREKIEEMRSGFLLAQERGDELHLREHARFLLRLGGDARGALELARRNFLIQKEPDDLQLLLEAAETVGDETVQRTTVEWAETNQPATLAHHRRFARATPRP